MRNFPYNSLFLLLLLKFEGLSPAGHEKSLHQVEGTGQ